MEQSQHTAGDLVTLFTDGACIGNPGTGGYGAVLLYRQQRKELSGGFRLTTNNRMEIMAAIIGLETIRTTRRWKVTVYSDSRYLVDAMSLGRVNRWEAMGWRRSIKTRLKNADLWQRLSRVCERYDVQFVWVQGHYGNLENERCDALSKAAALGKADLCEDIGYTSMIETVTRQTGFVLDI